MGRADFFKMGDWNGICEECGKKFKYSTLKKSWDGRITCKRCYDPRHPQEYVRDVPDKQGVPEASLEPTDQFI